MRYPVVILSLAMAGSPLAATTTTAPAKVPTKAKPAVKAAAPAAPVAPATPAPAPAPAAVPVAPAATAPAPYLPPALPHIGPSATEAAPVAEVAAPVTPEEKPEPSKFVPLYQFHYMEAVDTINIGSFFFGSGMGTTMGGRWAFTPGQALYGAYELNYSGPGLRPQEGREFTERDLSHQASLGHEWSPVSGLALGSRALFQRQMRRSGGSDVFGTGLYDYWTIGLTERADMKLAGFATGASLSYALVHFPNYTDLLNEYQSASVEAEKSGGLQDYNRITTSFDGKFLGQGAGWVNLTWMMFEHQKVLTDKGVPNTTAQFDSIYELGASWAQPLAGDSGSSILSVEPSVNVAVKRSNQNFLKYPKFGDLVNFEFVKDYYSDVSPTISAPLKWSFKAGTALFLSPSYSMLAYSSRPPRDATGTYLLGKKQSNSTFILTTGVSTSWHRFARVSFGYSVHVQQSNNRFERFLPYNYVGHVFFTSLDLAY